MNIKTTPLAILLLTAGSLFAADFSIGISIGPPPPPRVVRVRPVTPGPGYVWVTGYWYPEGRRYKWHDGYWTRPPYEGAVWVAPRHENGLFYNGYWEGSRGRFEHDHRWDHERKRRDWDRDRDHDHDRH
jgi:hypothetical protein